MDKTTPDREMYILLNQIGIPCKEVKHSGTEARVTFSNPLEAQILQSLFEGVGRMRAGSNPNLATSYYDIDGKKHESTFGQDIKDVMEYCRASKIDGNELVLPKEALALFAGTVVGRAVRLDGFIKPEDIDQAVQEDGVEISKNWFNDKRIYKMQTPPYASVETLTGQTPTYDGKFQLVSSYIDNSDKVSKEYPLMPSEKAALEKAKAAAIEDEGLGNSPPTSGRTSPVNSSTTNKGKFTVTRTSNAPQKGTHKKPKAPLSKEQIAKLDEISSGVLGGLADSLKEYTPRGVKRGFGRSGTLRKH